MKEVVVLQLQKGRRLLRNVPEISQNQKWKSRVPPDECQSEKTEPRACRQPGGDPGVASAPSAAVWGKASLHSTPVPSQCWLLLAFSFCLLRLFFFQSEAWNSSHLRRWAPFLRMQLSRGPKSARAGSDPARPSCPPPAQRLSEAGRTRCCQSRSCSPPGLPGKGPSP